MNEFEEAHIDVVWKYLHSKFGFDVPKWKKKFNQFRVEHHMKNRGYDKDVVSDFRYFGVRYIEPVLNQILCRYEGTNTFNRMINFILTGKNQN